MNEGLENRRAMGVKVKIVSGHGEEGCKFKDY